MNKIKAYILINLMAGFLCSIYIPRLLLERFGGNNYGLYSLVLGFAGVLAFSDLGLQAGLSRELSRCLELNKKSTLRRAVGRLNILVSKVWAIITIAIFIIGYFYMKDNNKYMAAHVFLVFAVATLVTIYAEILSGVVRAGGEITSSYFAKTVYYVSQLILSVLFVRLASGDIWLVCWAQLISSLIYFSYLLIKYIKMLGGGGEGDFDELGDRRLFEEAWKISSPERLNKIMQLVSSLIERPLLLGVSGALLVTSYDLLMRIGQLITVLPAAIGQPLQSMIAFDNEKNIEEKRFIGFVIFAKRATKLISIFGFFCAIFIWYKFHERIFHVKSEIPGWLAVLVLLTIAINASTAPMASNMLATGRISLMKVKAGIEISGMLVAMVAALYTKSALIFVAVRFGSIGVAAVYFMSNSRKREWL